ncbi:PREDICTED: putative lipid-transfer protein DIR1 [Ipomoea nil]|uniref:putative lipid-transfer protein DIR1 n=1 Tax=Ipomoea nil TaxID=35883 RepID=UPI000900E08F|nr:PREDICTED: putative lipid-transfer protein DIR1 [Ipomoea nil]
MEAYTKLSNVKIIVLAVVMFGAIGEVCHAQSVCNMSREALMSCRPAVTPPNPPPPSAACCTAISHADIGCLCSYKNSSWLPSLGVDPNLAMTLPKKCKLSTATSC